MRVGTGEGLCFDRSFLGDRARLVQWLHHVLYLEVLGDPLKNDGPTNWGHYTDQTTPFKR